ncbi:hypothetical protein QUF72_05440, partial [Desulfobacterales bacterium HSG2]|nr:hypothetical protein [Desulfobacterales bacterium HSG2]
MPPVIPAATCHSCERRNPLLPTTSHLSFQPPVIPAKAGIHFCRQPATCHSCRLSFLRTQESTLANTCHSCERRNPLLPPVIPAATCHSCERRNP